MHTNGTGLLLWRTANAWQRAVRAALRPHGLTQGQYVLLQALLDGEMIQGHAAGHVGLDAAAASAIVRQVRAQGWATVRGDAADARAKVLSLTDAGHALVTSAEGDVTDATDRFFAPLAGNRPAFTGALAVLIGLRPRIAAARPKEKVEAG